MSEKKKIPCRVCGKLFEPCSYCQSHADVFRWRNFACSRECATKYINDTITYRESLKQTYFKPSDFTETEKNNKKVSSKSTTAKKKNIKNTSTETIIVENNETE